MALGTETINHIKTLPLSINFCLSFTLSEFVFLYSVSSIHSVLLFFALFFKSLSSVSSPLCHSPNLSYKQSLTNRPSIFCSLHSMPLSFTRLVFQDPYKQAWHTSSSLNDTHLHVPCMVALVPLIYAGPCIIIPARLAMSMSCVPQPKTFLNQPLWWNTFVGPFRTLISLLPWFWLWVKINQAYFPPLPALWVL